MRGRHGWPGSLDFGTLRDLERVAVQFTSDLRRVAMQSSAAGENVISDLRTILEDALERIKSEIFGSGQEAAHGRGPDPAGSGGGSGSGGGQAGPAGTSPAGTGPADTPPADTPPAGTGPGESSAAGSSEKPAGQD
jgi:hypothetical protein